MNDVIIPRPVYIVIDDVGWWSGTNGSHRGEPYRTGMDRPHCVADYEALDTFAVKLGVKPQVALVIGEWDRHNILKNVPHSNWDLSAWDNSRNVGIHLDSAMKILNRGNLCVALHGLCHEYWEEKGVFSRAEFGYERDMDIVRQHLDAYFQILHDNGFAGQIRAFVPPAFCYTANEISGLLQQYGIQYISTIFKNMKYEGHADRYILENGIITCDRCNNLISWNVTNASPPEENPSGFFGLHWPNLLHPDPQRNGESVERWVHYFNRYKNEFGMLLAKDEEEGHVQSVYEKDGTLTITDDGVVVEMPSDFALSKGCYLHSRRPLQLEPVRTTSHFYEYLLPATHNGLIPWR